MLSGAEGLRVGDRVQIAESKDEDPRNTGIVTAVHKDGTVTWVDDLARTKDTPETEKPAVMRMAQGDLELKFRRKYEATKGNLQCFKLFDEGGRELGKACTCDPKVAAPEGTVDGADYGDRLQKIIDATLFGNLGRADKDS